MMHERSHPTDRELLLAADGELSLARRARVEGHLEGCASCAARLRQIDVCLRAAAACRDLHAPLPPSSVGRARLRSRLAELAQEPARSTGAAGSWALACCAALVASVGLTWLASPRTTGSSASRVFSTAVVMLPNPDLTPGIASAAAVSEICGTRRPQRPEPVALDLRRRVFESYGADLARSAEYELDYLITPELGGVADARNLWPQPFAGTPWNAYVKDELELHFHRMACDGGIDLAAAQREMATDWIAAYKRHFRTDKPLRDYATEPLTDRDGDLLRAELDELGLTPPVRSDGSTLMALLQSARLIPVQRHVRLLAPE